MYGSMPLGAPNSTPSKIIGTLKTGKKLIHIFWDGKKWFLIKDKVRK